MQHLSHENNFTPMFIFIQIKLIHINNFKHGLVLKREVKVNGPLETVNYKLQVKTQLHELNYFLKCWLLVCQSYINFLFI